MHHPILLLLKLGFFKRLGLQRVTSNLIAADMGLHFKKYLSRGSCAHWWRTGVQAHTNCPGGENCYCSNQVKRCLCDCSYQYIIQQIDHTLLNWNILKCIEIHGNTPAGQSVSHTYLCTPAVAAPTAQDYIHGGIHVSLHEVCPDPCLLHNPTIYCKHRYHHGRPLSSAQDFCPHRQYTHSFNPSVFTFCAPMVMNLISGIPGHFCNLSLAANILIEHAMQARNPARTTNTCWTFWTKVPQHQLIIISCELQKSCRTFTCHLLGLRHLQQLIFLAQSQWPSMMQKRIG